MAFNSGILVSSSDAELNLTFFMVWDFPASVARYSPSKSPGGLLWLLGPCREETEEDDQADNARSHVEKDSGEHLTLALCVMGQGPKETCSMPH